MIEYPPRSMETSRLQLRAPVMEDAQIIYEQYAADSQVTRFLTWETHTSVKDTRGFIKRCRTVWENGEAFPWVLIHREHHQLLGTIEINDIQENSLAVGYVLARSHWGKGYMLEALKKIIEWGFTQPDIFRIWAVCDTENKASVRVMEKAGMSLEGMLRRWVRLPQMGEKPRDCYCFSIVR